jgi:hypothetical protein
MLGEEEDLASAILNGLGDRIGYLGLIPLLDEVIDERLLCACVEILVVRLGRLFLGALLESRAGAILNGRLLLVMSLSVRP